MGSKEQVLSMANNINRVEVLGMADHRWSHLCGLHGVSTQQGGHDHATMVIKRIKI